MIQDIFDNIDPHNDVPKKVFEEILNEYDDTNNYHNSYHAVDVLQASWLFVTHCRNSFLHFTNEELCFFLFCCLCHDIGHPGISNKRQEELKTYIFENHVSNEHYHVFKTCQLIEKYHLFPGISNKSALVYDIIIETDVERKTNILNKRWEKLIVLLKCADISHTLRLFSIHHMWVRKVHYELRIPIESVVKCTLHFYNNYALPLYNCAVKLMPAFCYFKHLMTLNYNMWKCKENEINKIKNKSVIIENDKRSRSLDCPVKSRNYGTHH